MRDEPACTFQDGQIWWRGCYRSREDAVAQAERFEAITDWMRPTALDFAQQIRAAIARYDRHHTKRIAA